MFPLLSYAVLLVGNKTTDSQQVLKASPNASYKELIIMTQGADGPVSNGKSKVQETLFPLPTSLE